MEPLAALQLLCDSLPIERSDRDWLRGSVALGGVDAGHEGGLVACLDWNIRRSTKPHMNVKSVVVSALVAGAMVTAGTAQTAAPQAPAAPAAKAPPPPQAIPAKIAIIEFEQVAEATNEGLKANADLQKKYEPKRAELLAAQTEIDSLTKQLQNAPATMTDAEKASRARTIDTKQKQLQRDADDAQTAFGGDMQDAIGKIEQKLGPLVMKYVQQNGYTLLLDRSPLVDNSGQPLQGGLNILWAQGGVDISQAIVNDYNATTPGISAPLPPAPSAAHPAASRPAAPKPAAPKQ